MTIPVGWDVTLAIHTASTSTAFLLFTIILKKVNDFNAAMQLPVA